MHACRQLRVVALALAGLSEERLWRESLAAAAPALPDAYLRALLHFLAASSCAHAAPPDLSAVLVSDKILYVLYCASLGLSEVFHHRYG